MAEGSADDVYLGAETPDKGVVIEGPLSLKEAGGVESEMQKKGGYVHQVHAKNRGGAILKMLTTFINREKHNIK